MDKWSLGLVCHVTTLDWLSDDIAYTVTKGLHEGYNYYKDISGYASTWNYQTTSELLPAFPTHPGAIKYWKDAGLWTKEMDEHNKKMLKEEKERMKS